MINVVKRTVPELPQQIQEEVGVTPVKIREWDTKIVKDCNGTKINNGDLVIDPENIEYGSLGIFWEGFVSNPNYYLLPCDCKIDLGRGAGVRLPISYNDIDNYIKL